VAKDTQLCPVKPYKRRILNKMAQNNSGSVNFNFKHKNIQTSMINIEVFKPKTFTPRVPGTQPTPGKRRTV